MEDINMLGFDGLSKGFMNKMNEISQELLNTYKEAIITHLT